MAEPNGNGNGNGNGHKQPTDYTDVAIEVMIVGVVLMLVIGFVTKWLLTETIDSQMYKEVLIFVLGSVTGSISKGVVQRAMTSKPPQASGTTMTTVVSDTATEVKVDKKV